MFAGNAQRATKRFGTFNFKKDNPHENSSIKTLEKRVLIKVTPRLVVFKRVKNVSSGLRIVKSLDKQGFRAAQVTDANVIKKSSKGTVVLAFKNEKSTPKGFKTKKILF